MLKEIIDEKVQLLYDFCILTHHGKSGKGKDKREKSVRAMLAECGTERKMTVALHDVLMGRETINQVLQRKELM